MSNSSKRRYVRFQDKKDVFGGFGLIAAVYFVVMFTAARPLHEWVFTQWMFSYEIKFVKRALHVEILRLLGIEISYLMIFTIVLILLFVLNAALFLVFSRPLRTESVGDLSLREQFSAKNWADKPIHIGLGLFFLMALLHSTTLQRFFQFPGYLEHLQLALVLGALVLLHRVLRSEHRSSNLYSFLMVGGLCFTALFIHEGFLFFYLPMIFMYWIYRIPGTVGYNLLRFMLLAGLIIETWLIGTYGLLPPDQYQPLLNDLQSRFGAERVDVESMKVLFRGFSSNLHFTWYWFEQRLVGKLIHLVCTIIILSPIAYVFWRLYKDDFREGWRILFKKSENQSISTPKNSVLRSLLMLSCFTPFILIPIGIDLFRWISISTLNLFVMTFFLMVDKDFRDRSADIVYEIRYMAIFVIALSLIFGVLGITNSFSWVYKLTTNLGFGV